jgi:methionyl-tRNA formyltransferase
MEEQTNPRVKVMRSSDTAPEPAAVDEGDEVFGATLANGRYVELREMNAGDLLYLEKTLGNIGDMERSMKLATRLSTSAGKITFEELQKLKMKDLKKITDLLGKAGGTDEDEEDPN